MTLYESAAGAVLPWNSIDAESALFDALPQQEIEVCLMCEHCADACDRCDGKGNLSVRGRPPIQIDVAALREMMRLKRCNREMCAALGVSRKTLIKAKKTILNEEAIYT